MAADHASCTGGSRMPAAGLRSSARRTWRSFKSFVKGNTLLRKGYLRLKGRYHRARLRRAGLRTNPADRSARTGGVNPANIVWIDRKSTRLNSSHANTSYAVFCLKKKHLLLLYRPLQRLAATV